MLYIVIFSGFICSDTLLHDPSHTIGEVERVEREREEGERRERDRVRKRRDIKMINFLRERK